MVWFSRCGLLDLAGSADSLRTVWAENSHVRSHHCLAKDMGTTITVLQTALDTRNLRPFVIAYKVTLEMTSAHYTLKLKYGWQRQHLQRDCVFLMDLNMECRETVSI